jgi:uncharacterized protein YrrD
MKKGREVVGLPVVSLSSAARLGTVVDLSIDPGRRTVEALLLADSPQQQPTRLVPFRAVREVGPHAVMVGDESSVAPVSGQEGLHTLGSAGSSQLSGIQLLTEGGRVAGSVSDVVFDERTGVLTQYEISFGHVQDLVSGRRYISSTAPRSVSGDLMIVSETVLESPTARLREGPPLVLEEPTIRVSGVTAVEVERAATDAAVRQEQQVVGMRAGMTIGNEDAGGVICFEGEPITQEVLERARAAGKVNLLIEGAREGMRAAESAGAPSQMAHLAVGHMAGCTVRTPAGEVVVSQGDVVTDEVFDRARQAGVMDQLMEAVMPTPQEYSDRWAGRREAARALWEQVGGRLGQLVGRR